MYTQAEIVMTQPRDCFVAIFDIIAFKGLLKELGALGLLKRYHRGVLPAIQHAAAGRSRMINIDDQMVLVPEFHATSLRLRIFSDTVIFYTLNDSFDSFLSIVNASFNLLRFGFSGSKMPFRGAIAHGDLIDDGDLFIAGTALVAAHTAAESQVWSGCMLSDCCLAFAKNHEYISQFFATKYAERLIEYDVPLQKTHKPNCTKYYNKRAYVVNWTPRMYNGAASVSFENSDDKHAQGIIANTSTFEEWARETM